MYGSFRLGSQAPNFEADTTKVVLKLLGRTTAKF